MKLNLPSRKKAVTMVLIMTVGVAAVALITVSFLVEPDNPVIKQAHRPGVHEQNRPAEARYWRQLDREQVLCLLCVHHCIIGSDERGICRVRENRDGHLYTLVYGLLAANQFAPIEKDGMKHVLPGTDVLAIATAGCNFHCKQCHNWHITQHSPEKVGGRRFTPQTVVGLALQREARTITGSINEPTVFFEFLYDVAILARQAGLRMQFHTNGAIAEAPLRTLLRRLDQVVVDLKGFCPAVYRQYFGGCLEGVLRTLKIIKEEGAWLEITNLVIPGVNDCMDAIRAMSKWILKNLGPDVPLHFTRFHPSYRLTHLPPTPVATLEEAHRTAREAGINFVTIGNVPGHRYNSTFCPCTGERLIHRVHFTVVYNKIVDGKSPFSGRPVPGIWE